MQHNGASINAGVQHGHADPPHILACNGRLKSAVQCLLVAAQVDGDHRVGIFAARDMEAGTELYYDYKYDTACAPVWAKRFTDLG